MVQVSPSWPALIKAWVSSVTLGEVDWTARSTHQHRILGTSQVRAHALPYAHFGSCRLFWENWGSGSSLGHSEPGPVLQYGQGHTPLV